MIFYNIKLHDVLKYKQYIKLCHTIRKYMEMYNVYTN